MGAVGRAPEAHRGRLKPKFRQPSTWLVSPELCARSRDRAAKHAAGRQRDASVWAVKRYHHGFAESSKKVRSSSVLKRKSKGTHSEAFRNFFSLRFVRFSLYSRSILLSKYVNTRMTPNTNNAPPSAVAMALTDCQTGRPIDCASRGHHADF